MTIAEAIEAERIEAEAGNLKAARKLQVRIQEKFTFPMACVVFGLIGSSLGSRPGSRTSRSQGFGISILLILGYYAPQLQLQFPRGEGRSSRAVGGLAAGVDFPGGGHVVAAAGQSLSSPGRIDLIRTLFGAVTSV